MSSIYTAIDFINKKLKFLNIFKILLNVDKQNNKTNQLSYDSKPKSGHGLGQFSDFYLL